MAIGSGESIPIGAQRVMVFTGSVSGSTLSYSAASLGPPDDLDTWSATRDRQEEESPSRQYVADDTPGAYELDDNGRWQNTPEYGYVWSPVVVVANWVPYRYGHWVWIAPWGWTWVDDAPWGYATFHYGRWVSLHGAWCWVPGPQPLRPIYAPAQVAWTHGPGFAAAGAAAPAVGWFPLGPHEVYAPASGVSASYLRNVNTANTTIASTSYITDVYQGRITNIRYLNGNAAAISAVPESVFTSAQGVARHVLPVTATALAGMTVAAAAPAVTPQRQSVLGPGTGPKVAHPPPALANRPVVAHTALPRAPASFDAQQAAIQANGGRALSRADLARLPAGIPTARVRVLASIQGSRPSPANQGGAPPSLAERARTLETPAVPSSAAAPTLVYKPSAAAPAQPAHTDRPPWASQGSFSTYDPGHVPVEPAPAAATHRPETPPAIAASAPAPVAHPTQVAPGTPLPGHPLPPPAKSQKAPAEHARGDSREEANPHADRSRDRVER